MRIGIDARELCGRPTGVGRYLAGLLQCWSRDAGRRHEFVLFAHATPDLRLDTRRFATRTLPGSGGTWWEQMQLPGAAAAEHLDVFFSPAYSAPIRLTTPLVVAIHDLSFVAHPEWFRLREGARRRLLARLAADRARAVITISQFSRDEIVEHLGVATDKIHVVPPGISLPPSRSASVATGASSEGILYVGSIFNRRHVVDLLRGFAPIARSHPSASLDIVGDDRTYPREDLARVVRDEELESSVRWHRYVSDEQLERLFDGARAFAFLSEYEGLGLTPLEALARGIPPVLLDTPVARESCGDAALYVPVNDVSAITSALAALLYSDAVRQRLLAAAPSTLARYDWPRAAAETLRVLEQAAASA